jgi:immunoglobulin-binding protein 1
VAIEVFMAAENVKGQSLEQLFGNAVSLTWAAGNESWPGFEYLALSAGAAPAQPRRVTGAAAMTAAATASDAAVAAVTAVANAARAAGVLSANETLEDISTSALRFVLVPYLASTAHAAWQGAPAGRLEHLKAARAELGELFRAFDALGLLTQVDRDSVLDGMPELVQTPQQRRDLLIGRHREEKAAAEKLKSLLERRLRRGSTGEDGDEEDAEREAMLTILQSAVRRAMQSITSLDLEIDILRYAVASDAKGIDPAVRAAREKPRGPPPGMNGMPSTFRIVDEREKARQQVFRPSHSLPTYTVEEWGQFEMQRLAQATQEQQAREGVRARVTAEEDSDGDEASNRETYEKRRWDNWKDEHNKGSGNSQR